MSSSPITANRPRTLILPDLVSYCSFDLAINEGCEVCSADSIEWIASFGDLSEKQRASMASIKLGTLAAMSWPSCDIHGLRIGADFMNYVFWLDDYTDGLQHTEALRVREVVVDILRQPEAHCEQGRSGSALEKLTYDIWMRMLPQCGEGTKTRFIEANHLFLQAVYGQSVLCIGGELSLLDGYIMLRRDDGGAKPMFVLIEYALGWELPSELVDDPVIKRLEDEANDMIVWSNDIFSFKKEQARGDRNNLITIVMEEKGLSMQEAFDFVGDMWKARFHDFKEDRKKLPSWGEVVNRQVEGYVQGLADWVVGNIHWSFASKRYFESERDFLGAHVASS
ncbi:terpenoid synthase [Dacryopinax primogenitus]|uniref:Terpene synthase n=1 Tax=Dacryopinax primogenitus (strain DJM 731) TaxID=1858805 RepID=M5FSC0_DACPD|nr:terpenoid synthase [Dacryopinax primogenitus]EJU00296.1 terpenoid synthase [Dacryopinax primogenitus]